VKKAIAVLLAMLMLCGIAPLMTGAADGIDITDKFTDPAFKAAVQEIIGKDVILNTDVAGIWGLDVSGTWYAQGAITSLEGLECFIDLAWLGCSDNQLAILPALPSGLITLVCAGNSLTALPELPSSLRGLYCWSNQLSTLPALPSGLDILACSTNKLTSLPELPPSLTTLSCWDNDLTALPRLPAGLTYLDCSHNQLTSVDVTGLNLAIFWCDNNNMASMSALKGLNGNIGSFSFYPQNTVFFWSAWPSPLQWILEYILFGWLWMRWL
jgi:hypothetical protein